MKHYLKQSTELAINLMHKFKNDPFQKAHLKLTAFYTLVTMIIVVVFSFVLFFSLQKNAQDIVDESIDTTSAILYQDIKHNIEDVENTIFVVDFILLFLVSGLGYVIAGKTLKPIKETLESQKRFLADASHDLRTPLAIIKSEAQVLIQSNSDQVQDYKKVVESTLEEINKMSRLVDDLLIIARTDVIHINTIIEKFDVQNLLQKITSKMEIQAHKKNITLILKDSIPFLISGNTHTLERAIRNIVQNAINYTPNNGTVSLSLTQEKNVCLLEITDTGVGINQKDLPYVFDRFYKTEHSRNDGSGSGLGLPITKQIVEQHGGSIKLLSKVGIGTEVIITIPIT